MVAEKRIVALMNDPSKLDKHNFVYPELVSSGIIYGEEIEEAIIEYLEKRGFNREALQSNVGLHYQDVDDVHYHTTKVLKITIK